MFLNELAQAVDPGIERQKLVAHYAQDPIGNFWHCQLIFGAMATRKRGYGFDACWQDVTKLAKNASDHVHYLRALPYDQVPRPMDRKNSLLFL